MLWSGFENPSRTVTRALLPSLRINPCRAMPLPRASPSGLRCEVMRKLRPSRMRAPTSAAAVSGLVVGIGVVVVVVMFWLRLGFRCDLHQDFLDPAGAHGRLVVLEVELRREAEPDALPEELAHAAAEI